jgi:hypothetical protein
MKKNWYAMFPGDAYATQLFNCDTKQEAKQVARDFLGVQKLPNGTDIWSSMGV